MHAEDIMQLLVFSMDQRASFKSSSLLPHQEHLELLFLGM